MEPRQVFAAYGREGEGTDYNYCPRCGERLGARDDHAGDRQRCTACGWVHYRNPLPGAVTVIVDDNHVLLGKRGSASFAPGLWCLPGGFVEWDEDFLTAARREAREETGLEVEIAGILSVATNFLSPRLHTLVVILLAHPIAGLPVPGDDLVELAWFSLGHGASECCDLPEMAFEADRHIVERYAAARLPGAPVDPRYAGGDHAQRD